MSRLGAAIATREIKRSRLRDIIVEQLLLSMRDGSVRPGEFLPNERDLAQQFGVGRASLRDAIAQLELLGYVQARQGEGTVVLDPTGADLVKPFRGLLASRPYLAADLLEFRLFLEPGVAAVAAERADDDDIAALKRALEDQHERAASGERLSDADLTFHELVARSARNDVTLNVLSALRELLLSLREVAMSENRPAVTIAEHAAIVDAIASRDPAAARAAMEHHLHTVLRSANPTSVARAGDDPSGSDATPAPWPGARAGGDEPAAPSSRPRT